MTLVIVTLHNEATRVWVTCVIWHTIFKHGFHFCKRIFASFIYAELLLSSHIKYIRHIVFNTHMYWSPDLRNTCTVQSSSARCRPQLVIDPFQGIKQSLVYCFTHSAALYNGWYTQWRPIVRVTAVQLLGKSALRIQNCVWKLQTDQIKNSSSNFSKILSLEHHFFNYFRFERNLTFYLFN